MATIEIQGWKKGANTVQAIKVLANDAGLGLHDGKRVIDRALEAPPVTLDLAGDDLAAHIVSMLQSYGIDARVRT